MSRPRHKYIGLARPGILPGPVPLGPASGRINLRVVKAAWPDRERIPDQDRPTVPPPQGARGDDPVDLLAVVDDSGSTASTDPHGWRYVALRRIANLLASGLGGPALQDRIGVVHFADTATPWLPLTAIRTKPQRRQVRQALQPLTGGGTAIVPAITRAAQLQSTGKLFRDNYDRVPVVLLFTDGESAESTRQLTRAVEKHPVGSVHVVVLGDELPSQWEGVPLGSVTALSELRTPDDVEWVLARALYRSLSLDWVGPLRPSTATGELTTSLSNKGESE